MRGGEGRGEIYDTCSIKIMKNELLINTVDELLINTARIRENY